MTQEQIVAVKSIADKSVYCIGITTEESGTFKAFTDSASVIEQAVKEHSGETLLNTLAAAKHFPPGTYFTEEMPMPKARTCVTNLAMLTLTDPTAPNREHEALTRALIKGLEGNDEALTELLRSTRGQIQEFASRIVKYMSDVTKTHLLRELHGQQSHDDVAIRVLINEISDSSVLIEIFGDSIYDSHVNTPTLSRLSDIDRPGLIAWLKTRVLDETLSHNKRQIATRWFSEPDPEFESALFASVESILLNGRSYDLTGWRSHLKSRYSKAYEQWMISIARDSNRPIIQRIAALDDCGDEFKQRYCYREAVRDILNSPEVIQILNQAAPSKKRRRFDALRSLRTLDKSLFFDWARELVLDPKQPPLRRQLLLKACVRHDNAADGQDLLEELQVAPHENEVLIQLLKEILRYR